MACAIMPQGVSMKQKRNLINYKSVIVSQEIVLKNYKTIIRKLLNGEDKICS